MATPRVNRPHLKAGRKEKPLPATLEQIETLAGLGLTEEEIALYLGVTRKTLHRRKRVNQDLADVLKRGKIRADVTVVKALYTKATQQSDTTAMIFWLKNRWPDRWRDRQQIDGNLNITGKVSMVELKKSMKEYQDGSGC